MRRRSSRKLSSSLSCSREMICTAASRRKTCERIFPMTSSARRRSSRSAAILARTVRVTVFFSTVHEAPDKCGRADGICAQSASVSHAAYFSGSARKSSASVGQATKTSTARPLRFPNISARPCLTLAYSCWVRICPA